MASLKEVRNRIQSVSSTQQITKAMKMVAAAKLRRAQDNITRMRPYAQRLTSILANLTRTTTDEVVSEYGQVREVRRVLEAGGAAGKRLDFLMQELHREANTLGSKSVDAELSQASLELKVLIEQMREQVQNLE